VTVKRYDAAGRLAFQSYPMASLSSYASTTLKGGKTTYDALGRVTQAQQDSELGVLTTTTAYQSGLKIKVTDPRGNATTTSYLAYDQPTTDWPVIPRVKANPQGQVLFCHTAKPTQTKGARFICKAWPNERCARRRKSG
jgi:hypothetical protein